MIATKIVDPHVEGYESWFERNPLVFQSEIKALREMLPEGDRLSGMEVGLGTGRYAIALGIKEGVESSLPMRRLATGRGIEIMGGAAERLPYADLRFDFVTMVLFFSFIENLHTVMKEVFRVLKREGSLILGFIDHDSIIGELCKSDGPEGHFYRQAGCFKVEKIINELVKAGFRNVQFKQTLFGSPDDITTVQQPLEGYGEGSFIVVKAIKKSRSKQ